MPFTPKPITRLLKSITLGKSRPREFLSSAILFTFTLSTVIVYLTQKLTLGQTLLFTLGFGCLEKIEDDFLKCLRLVCMHPVPRLHHDFNRGLGE